MIKTNNQFSPIQSSMVFDFLIFNYMVITKFKQELLNP